jgi:hypothetical protein
MSAIKDKACPENPNGGEANSSQSEADDYVRVVGLGRSQRGRRFRGL